MKICGYCLEPIDSQGYCVNQLCYRNKSISQNTGKKMKTTSLNKGNEK